MAISHREGNSVPSGRPQTYLCHPVELGGRLQVSALLGVQRRQLVLPLPAPQQRLGALRAWGSREESGVAGFPRQRPGVRPPPEREKEPNSCLGGKTAREEVVSSPES